MLDYDDVYLIEIRHLGYKMYLRIQGLDDGGPRVVEEDEMEKLFREQKDAASNGLGINTYKYIYTYINV
jgi:hypothetical protein